MAALAETLIIRGKRVDPATVEQGERRGVHVLEDGAKRD